VPRPRKNTALGFGVLAAHAERCTKLVRRPERKTTRTEDAGWVARLKHSIGLDVLGGPTCEGRLVLVAVLFDTAEVKRRLQHLRLFRDAVPIRAARDPPDLWTETFDFDGPSGTKAVHRDAALRPRPASPNPARRRARARR
jgi:hypothetical protein